MTNLKAIPAFFSLFSRKKETGVLYCRVTHTKAKKEFIMNSFFVGYARLPQRVAMDDLASYFVEERSKVR